MTTSTTDITVIRQYWELLAIYIRQTEECQSMLTVLCETHFPTEYRRLQTIPGVKERAATAIIAETGVDMKMFATATTLVGWCGLKPRNDVSNGRYKSRRITHGNKYLRQILIEMHGLRQESESVSFPISVTFKSLRSTRVK